MTLPKPASVANLQVTQQYTVTPNAYTLQPTYTVRGNVADLGAFPYP